DLAHALVAEVAFSILAGQERLFLPFVPEDRMERRPFVVDGERMACPLYAGIEPAGRQLPGPNPLADPPRHFLDRCAIGGDRVPKAEEADSRVLPIVRLGIFTSQQEIANPAHDVLDAPERMEVFCAKGPICRTGLGVQLRLRIRFHETLFED